MADRLRLSKSGDAEVWTRPLSGGAQAIALFSRSAEAAKITVKWTDLGRKSAPAYLRDLWTHSDLSPDGEEYSAVVPPHGVVMLRASE